MFVLIDEKNDSFSFGNTLDDARKAWFAGYNEPVDLTDVIIVQGKRKKAEIVLTDYPEPKKPAKPAAK